MATEIASLLITAESQTGDAERGLDRLNQKYDKTVANLQSGQGRVASFGQANRRAAGDIDTHSNALGNLRTQLQGGAQDIQRIGTVLTASITLPMAAASAAIINIGVKTSSSLNVFQSVTRATDQQMKELRATARALGADLSLPGTSAADSALAMVELAKGGLSLKESMEAARGTIQLARAATVDEAQAATIAADALNTFSLAGDQAGRVADLLAGAANASSGEITHMAQALAQAGAVARDAEISIEDTATAISLLAKNGIKGSDAGTSLKTFLLALRTPISSDSVKIMKTLGLSVFDLQGNMKPLPQIIDQFRTRLERLNPQARAKALREIFGQDAIRAAGILFREGKAGFDAMQTAITRQGSAAEIAAAKAKGLGGAWEGLKSTLETFADDVFQDLEAPLTKIVEGLASGVQFLANAWNNLGPSAKAAVGALLGIAAAIGPVLVVIGTVAAAVLGLAGSIASLVTASAAVGGLAALGSILLPVGAVIAGLVVVITEWVAISVAAAFAIHKAWTTNFLGIRDLTFRAWNAVKTFVVQVWQELRAAYFLIMPQLETLTRNVLGVIQAFWSAHGEKIVSVVRFAWNIVTTVIRTAIRVVSSVIAGVLAVINGDWQKAWDMAVRVVDTFVEAFKDILSKVHEAMKSLVAYILRKTIEFYEAGKKLAAEFVTGLIREIYNSGPRVAHAVLGLALLLTSPGMLAAYAAAGVAQARARNEAFEASLKNPTPGESARETPVTDAERSQFDATARSVRPKLPKRVREDLPDLPDDKKSGESAAARRFKLEVRSAEVFVQEAERLNQKWLSDADYAYSQGLSLLDQYVLEKQVAVQRLFAAETLRNMHERAALEASKITGRERVVAFQELSEKEKATRQKHEMGLTEIKRFAEAQRLAMQHSTQDAQIALAEESASGIEAMWQRLADQGVVTFAEAQRRISESQLKILQMQEQVLATRLTQSGLPGSEPYQRAEADLQRHRERMKNFRAQMNADGVNANRRDLDALNQHQGFLRSIHQTIEDMETETARDRLRILEQAGLKKEIVWQREMEIEIQIEQRRRARRVAELERERAYTEQFEAEGEKKRQKIEELNRLIEAEEQRSAQRRESIQAEFLEKHRQKLREAADQIMGVFKTALDRYKEDGFKGFFKSLGESFREELERMALDLLKSRVLSLLQTVFKVPQVTAQGGTSPNQQSLNANSFDFGGVLTNLFRGVFGGGSQGQPTANHASPTAAIGAAGAAMSEAILRGGERAAQGVEKQGTNVTGSLTSIGQGIISTMLQVGSMLAAANTRGSFWKGLLVAAGVGAINGLTNGLFGGAGGSGSQGGIGSAAGDAIGGLAGGGLLHGPGTGTSDSILGVDDKGMPIARVSAGEYVVNAMATQRHLALLEAINSNSLPRHNRGGVLGSHGTMSMAAITGGYQPPAPRPTINHSASPVHKHFYLNVTHRGGSDPKQIQKSVAQVRRAYSEMVQQTASDLN